VLVDMLARGREAELVELLLERYYDPLYRHSERARTYAARFDARDPAAAADAIVRWIENERLATRARSVAASDARTPRTTAPVRADL
jgi:uncharacterized protein involved in type VI secretion and phage assembly